MGRLGGPEMKEILEAGVQSLCCVPLLAGNRVVGTLLLGAAREKVFGEYLQQVGMQIGAAIHNAISYREIAQLKERLTQENRDPASGIF